MLSIDLLCRPRRGLDDEWQSQPTAGAVGYVYGVGFADCLADHCAAMLYATISLALRISSLPPAIAG
jgi:hypothetical protein